MWPPSCCAPRSACGYNPSMDPINVLITCPFSEPLIARLEAVSSRLHIRVWQTHSFEEFEEIEDRLAQVEILYTDHALPQPEQAPKLRWVQLHYAGVDEVINHPLFQSHVLFTTVSGIHAVAMAEYVMTYILAFARRLSHMLEDKAHGAWSPERLNRYMPDELRGATLGVVGYGSVGRQVARLASAFGMQVLAVKRNAMDPTDSGYTLPGTGDPEGNIPERIYPPQALRSFLSECDYVVLTVPLTDETYHMIDADTLETMRQDAILINVARGAVVDEAALIEALQEGLIGGAALDVFEEEPLPPDSPLWTLPNVLISPHVAGLTPRYDEYATDLFAENLSRYLTGQPLLNLVDKERGY
jgi:phosphoglycerate dehydrogenase-like enzyme